MLRGAPCATRAFGIPLKMLEVRRRTICASLVRPYPSMAYGFSATKVALISRDSERFLSADFSPLTAFARFAFGTFWYVPVRHFAASPFSKFYHGTHSEKQKAGTLRPRPLRSGKIPRTRYFLERRSSDVIIQVELIRMRAHPHRIGFHFSLVIDPQFDEILAEDAPFEEEFVVLLEFV